MADYQPKILGLLCNWCSYAGADLAGVSRIQYPPNIRIVRLMCSGRVDPVFIIDAFIYGIDGVLVAGCHIGDCHYISGNLQTERKIKILKNLCPSFLNERIRLEWVSASEGGRFANIVGEFTATIKKLGPLQMEPEKMAHLQALRNTLALSRLRILIGKEKELVEDGNVYHERMERAEFNKFLTAVADAELLRARILSTLQTTAHSVPEIAALINAPPDKIFRHILRLKRKGLVKVERIENNAPMYIATSGV